jgi:methyl-accepting chemotaxis protein
MAVPTSAAEEIMKFLNRSLNLQVSALVTVLIGTTFTILFLAISYWQKDNLVEEIHHASDRASSFLRLAIQDPMIVGDDTGTRSKFKEIATQFDDIRVFLTDFNGNVTYSTEEDAVRKDLPDVFENKRLNDLLQGSLKGEAVSGGILQHDGRPYYADVKSIANTPECHHCHGSSRAVLGSMVILLDSTASFAQLSTVQWKLAGLSLAGLIALIAALVFFLKRTVVSRVNSIERISDRISSGDLELTFESTGENEISRLGRNLTRMVTTIKDQLQYNKSVLQGIVLPLMITDEKETVTFANGQLQSLLGSGQSSLSGSAATRTLGEEGGKIIHEVLTSGTLRESKLMLSARDGAKIPVRLVASPLKNATGAVVGTIGVLIDLTREEEDKAKITTQQQNMLHVANQVTEVAIQLSSAAEELSQQMNELAQGLDVSSDQTSQVATAMEEMNATVLEVARNAGTTASSADDANKVAKEGGSVVDRTVGEITHVSQTTVSLSGTLNQLAGKVENIGQVMSVINDIADQTNLLALNAAIEAARAGDAGRGFAVVADEVRKLAEKTMQATKEVEKAITEIQSSTQEAVSEMGTTKGRVDNSTTMAKKAGEVLIQVMKKANSISDMVRNIATAAEQQSSTSEEINNNINQINVLTQESSRGVQQANMAIKEVAEMALRLRTLVEQFNR